MPLPACARRSWIASPNVGTLHVATTPVFAGPTGRNLPGTRGGSPLPPLEGGLSRAFVEEQPHRALQIAGAEERRSDAWGSVIGAPDAVVEERPHHALGGGVRPRRTLRESAGEAERLLTQFRVRQHATNHVPALQGRGVVEAGAHHELPCPGGTGPL